jgi:hypothetical protein
MRLLTRILPLAIVALVLPASAWATGRTTVAPPGASGISQYLEVVPTSSGASPPGTGGGPGGGAAHGGGLTDIQRRRLDGIGPDGRTLAAVVAATVPEQAGPAAATRIASPLGRTGASGVLASAPPEGAPSSSPSSGSPASLIVDAVSGGGGGGLGGFLPAFMLVSALAVAAAYAVRRRRTN